MTRLARLLPVLLVAVLPVAVQAQDYTYTSDGSAITITGYIGSGGDIVIPDLIEGLPVSSIGDYAFDGGTSLTSIAIPNSVTTIGNSGIRGCTSMTNITIPDSVISIGNTAFVRCESLTSITIPDSVTSIGHDVFYGCDSLISITADAANSSYSSLDGVLFNKTHTALIACPGGKSGSYMIPSSVTSVGEYAFIYCNSLTEIIVQNGVANIEVRAFRECTSLKFLYFEGDAPSLGSDVFNSVTAEVYYMPGTTGWTTYWGGLSTRVIAHTLISLSRSMAESSASRVTPAVEGWQPYRSQSAACL